MATAKILNGDSLIDIRRLRLQGITERTVELMVERGQLSVIKLGEGSCAHRYFKISEIEKVIAARTVRTAAA